MIEAVKRLQDLDTDTRYRATLMSNERITPDESDEEDSEESEAEERHQLLSGGLESSLRGLEGP